MVQCGLDDDKEVWIKTSRIKRIEVDLYAKMGLKYF